MHRQGEEVMKVELVYLRSKFDKKPQSRYAHCPLRMNGQIYGHEYGCDWESKDFVFVHCGRTNLDPDYEYWGGVRFSVKEFEQELFHSRIHDAVTHSSVRVQDSVLQFVQV